MVSIVDKMITLNNTFVGAISLNSNCYYYYCYYYDYYRPTNIYDLNCTGVENNILNCPYDDSYHYCNYYQDAAVICQCMNNKIACK